MAFEMGATSVLTRAIRRYAGRHPRVKAVLKTARFAPLAVSDRLWRARHRKSMRSLNTQRALTLRSSLSGAVAVSGEALSAKFDEVSEGSNAVFVIPRDRERQDLGLSDLHPGDIGVKILRDLRPPSEATYLHPNKASKTRTIAAGGISDNVAAANYLFLAGLGPRVWDVAELETTDGRTGTAFVVDAVRPMRDPTMSDHQAFMDKLDEHLEQGVLRISYPGWRSTEDFRGPDCNGNLIVGSRGPLYVDFQNFRVDQITWVSRLAGQHALTSHFGESRTGRPSQYLYQQVPGAQHAAKRNATRRWARITNALDDVGVSVEGRLVVDIGTNIGMMLHHALGSGAAWALGWDLPEVAAASFDMLLALGNTRLEVFGRNIDESYDFGPDVPERLDRLRDESVVLYLSVHQHLGLLKCIEHGAWRALVYEGHDGESLEEAKSLMRDLVGPEAKIGPIRMGVDGDSGPRPYAVAIRSDDS